MSLNPISDADFEFVQKLVREAAAIVLEPTKKYLVESRLTPLARELELGTIEKLITRIRLDSKGPLAARVVDAMTTNETSFFRDIHPFEALRKAVLPELLKRREREKRLSIWCAASSSGQEPYSLAMLVREHFPALRDWHVGLLATDISAEMLARARQGKFSQLEVNRGLPAPLLLKYFEKHGAEWQICEPMRRLVDYRPLNLAAPWPPLVPMDVVFIRNVLIYFDPETKKAILRKIRQVLRPDGYLFLGAADTTLNLDDSFERVQLDRAGCYRLRPAA